MRKTNKAVRKRFRITGTGKVIGGHAGRRHLAGSKKSKKRRSSSRAKVIHETDMHRVTLNLPFSRH